MPFYCKVRQLLSWGWACQRTTDPRGKYCRWKFWAKFVFSFSFLWHFVQTTEAWRRHSERTGNFKRATQHVALTFLRFFTIFIFFIHPKCKLKFKVIYYFLLTSMSREQTWNIFWASNLFSMSREDSAENGLNSSSQERNPHKMLSIAQGSNRGLAEGWSQGDLPGLNLTHNQLFFLSFAQVPSCSTWFWKFILVTLFGALGVVRASNSRGGSSFGEYFSFAINSIFLWFCKCRCIRVCFCVWQTCHRKF